MLRTDGNKIVNAYGTQITLRGTNLGGWLMQEGWMTPLGAGEIDHSFITKITTSASNEEHIPEHAIDTMTNNGIIVNNMSTYWQSQTAQKTKTLP